MEQETKIGGTWLSQNHAGQSLQTAKPAKIARRLKSFAGFGVQIREFAATAGGFEHSLDWWMVWRKPVGDFLKLA